jgi:hypothetical protein
MKLKLYEDFHAVEDKTGFYWCKKCYKKAKNFVEVKNRLYFSDLAYHAEFSDTGKLICIKCKKIICKYKPWYEK